MKKVIALVLAVALSLSMASVAFAAPTNITTLSSGSDVKPGTELAFSLSTFTSTYSAINTAGGYASADYFSIKVDYARGKELVKEVKFDGGDVVIVLKDEVKKIPSVANFQVKKITVTGKKDGLAANEKYRNKKYTLETAAATIALKVGYPKASADLTTSGIVGVPSDWEQFVKFKKATSNGADFETLEYAEGDVAFEVRVYKDEEFFLNLSTSVDLDVVKANPDAEINFYSFPGKPSFSANATLEIAADEGSFLYEIKDGKLVKSSLKYDEDAGAFIGKARTLGKYVVSDIELVAAAVAEETKNPDTGANDVVGVAVALAVVSLVAAGAVSLKK